MEPDLYPVVREDIYFAKTKTPTGYRVRIRNTTAVKDITLAPLLVVVLDLCTGGLSAGEIAKKFGADTSSSRDTVFCMLQQLQEKGVVTLEKSPISKPAEKSRRAKEISLDYPLETAQIEITNRCNLACVHCFNNSGTTNPHELTTEEIFTLIDVLSSMGVHKVTLTGGEPLLHPDLFDIVYYARKAPMSVNIFTNGTLITEDALKKFKKLCIRRFVISVDSLDSDIHDAFRGKKGALKKTLRAIDMVRKAGISVKPMISLSQRNKNGIIRLLKYFKSKSLTEFDIIPVRYSGRGINGLSVSVDEYFIILGDVYHYLTKNFAEALPEKKEKNVCGIARNTIGIKADGAIHPCPGCDQGPALGNVRDCDLQEFWKSNTTLSKIRKLRVEKDSACTGCSFHQYCTGCVAGAYSMLGKIQCHYPYLCALKRVQDRFGLL